MFRACNLYSRFIFKDHETSTAEGPLFSGLYSGSISVKFVKYTICTYALLMGFLQST